MPSLAARLRGAVLPVPARAAVPEGVQRAFDAHCQARLDHQYKLLEGALLVVNVVWWPFDWVVFAPFPWRAWALVPARVIHITVAALYLLLPRPPAVKRAIFWIGAAAILTSTMVGSDAAASLGGPENPYFHALNTIMLVTVFLPLPLPRRAGLTASLAVAVLVGLAVRHADHFRSPYFLSVVSFLVFGVLLSTWLGHTQFALARENFLQAHELAEQARLLESRVAERTDELRGLLHHVETAREGERTRIARELHDELGQELSALRYSLQYTKVRYSGEPGAVGPNLDELDDLLQRTAATTRHLVTDLRPRVLDDLGLDAAVEWLVRRTEERSELACHVTMPADLGPIDPGVATTAFRVLQEALTNVVRHAGARAIEVDVRAAEGRIELRVTDDGVGIDGARARRDGTSSGVGLLGMRERVHALGGSLSVVDRAPRRGTEVWCSLPSHPPTASGEHRPSDLSTSVATSAGAAA